MFVVFKALKQEWLFKKPDADYHGID